MIPELRRQFNERYSPERYQRFLKMLDDGCGTHIKFRNCETPIFLPRPLLDRMEQAGRELILQLMTPEYLKRSGVTIPAEYRVPNEDPRPLFIQVDFGLTEALEPKLVEIQAFPSLYAYQPFLQRTYRDAYELDLALDPSFEADFRRAVLGNHDPENVVLLEIDPLEQKTLPDFLLTEKMLGIKTVCITKVEKRGSRLFHDGVPIERIYNRVIVDELQRKQIQTPFDYRDDLQVEWAGHPNWYFRISKFSLPFLKHPAVPQTRFLSEGVPDDLENWVLKPLYSFAGLGVVIGPTRDDIARVKNPEEYILQERVNFASLIETPHGATKAEIRMMYLWLDDLRSVTTIIRMGRGKMMGVDHNRDLEWVGASSAFIVDRNFTPSAIDYPVGKGIASLKQIEPKHPAAIRWFHWINFPLLTIMIWSGMLIYWANDVYKVGWGDTTLFHFFPQSFYDAFSISSRLAEGMAWHFLFMWLFAINGVCYVLYTVISGEWRYLVPNRSTLREAIQVVLHDLHLSKTPLPRQKFNGAQKIAYTSIIVMGFGSLITGLAIWKSVQFGWLTAMLGGYAAARVEHFLLTLGYVGFFLIHIAQVIRAGWNNFRAMVTGFEVVDESE
jgi:thiosulfate reductase cytochrome b subunit